MSRPTLTDRITRNAEVIGDIQSSIADILAAVQGNSTPVTATVAPAAPAAKSPKPARRRSKKANKRDETPTTPAHPPMTLANVSNLENFTASNPVLIASNIIVGRSTTDPTVTHLGIVKRNNQTGTVYVTGYAKLTQEQLTWIAEALTEAANEA